MKKIALALLLAGLAAAQQLTISGPTGAVRAGSTVTLSVSLSGSAGQNIAALQGSLPNPGGTVTCLTGAAADSAQKQVSCAALNGNLIFIIWGMNNNVLTDGVVAQLQLQLPISIQGGTVTEGLTSTIAASSTGQGVAVTAATPFSLATVSACAITGGPTVTVADALAVIAQMLNGTPSANFDLNGDGIVNIIDVQRVVDAAVPGGACKVGQ